MGADFKGKVKKTFEKCWDKAAVEANTPDLFSKSSENVPNRFEADPIGDENLSIGESFCIRLENGEIIGRKGISPVFTITTPTITLVDTIKQGCAVASATVVARDPISGVFEVIINK